ncbi:hypothetical protein GQ44DRAFT_714242 [Phaeosphaeriaceae sp. PMI808]|nr:hypothetical protein GQ44DRAFT_714242 [Phaeosphaeriaceae sp. PMI808]
MVLAHTLQRSSATGEWTPTKFDLNNIQDKAHKLPYLTFLPESEYPNDEKSRRALLSAFNVPEVVSNDLGYRCNGYFGSKSIHNESGEIDTYSTWLRCLVKIVKQTSETGIGYTWHEMAFFSRWESNHRQITLCVNTPDNFQDNLEQNVASQHSEFDLSDPFALYLPIVDQIITLYDQSVWCIRDLIRRVEKGRELDGATETDFSELHEISRHATHSTETLIVAAQSIAAMQERHREFRERSISATSAKKTNFRDLQQHMEFQAQLIRNMVERSRSNQERLQSEITLAYNLITQRDSKIMVAIGEATNSDSSAMKTVAIVTMIFLPATFTSAVFSMSFFDYSPATSTEVENWSVSSKIWIYWAVAIPLTLLTLFAWMFWKRKVNLKLLVGAFLKNRVRRLQGEHAVKA